MSAETKVLKQRVRDLIDSKRDLGHSDVGGKKKNDESVAATEGGGKRTDQSSVSDTAKPAEES